TGAVAPPLRARFRAVILSRMSEATRILSAIEKGDPSAAEQLLPLVYDELRKLAAAKLAQERPGQTLSATALVHEAYLRLVANEAGDPPRWDRKGLFSAACAEAMRRILIDNARRKQADRRHRPRPVLRPPGRHGCRGEPQRNDRVAVGTK